MAPRFGIIGHGVVGSLFSRILVDHGAHVISYDRLLDDPELAPSMQKKIEEDRSKACSLAEVLGGSDYILSVITPQSCSEVASCASRFLSKHQVFVDLTSTSPAVKRKIAACITNGGSQFVEGVIVGAVSSSTSPVILLGGPAAERVAVVFRQYGLGARFYSPEIGRASAFKMVRSIFSKGLEAVLIETLVAARRAGILNDIWEEIQTILSTRKLEDTFQLWIRSHPRSAQRRGCEMQEVSQFLEEIDIRPLLPRASGEVFARSFALGIADAFPDEPESFRKVIEYLEQQQSNSMKAC